MLSRIGGQVWRNIEELENKLLSCKIFVSGRLSEEQEKTLGQKNLKKRKLVIIGRFEPGSLELISRAKRDSRAGN